MKPSIVLVSALLLIALHCTAANGAELNDLSLKRSLAPRVPFSQFPWAALIIASGSDNSIEYVCSGSILDANAGVNSHILTSAFCIQDRNDPSGKPATYDVLIENPEGNITLGTSKFMRFGVDKKYLHPNASSIREFSFTSSYPNGTSVDFSVAVAPYDVGILRLSKSLSGISGIEAVNLSKTIPKDNDPVSFVGYGGPQFFTLGATTGTVVIPSKEVAAGGETIPNGKLVFIHDKRSTVLPNETQAVEPGDEGSAMVNSQKQQVGIVIGSWQVNPNTTESVTFATLGPAIAPNYEYISSIMNEQTVQPSAAAQTMTGFSVFVAAALLVASVYF